jgi:hypothetical protein
MLQKNQQMAGNIVGTALLALNPMVRMLNAAPSPAANRPAHRLVVIKASRPSLIDLRFKGDPWVVPHGPLAALCLGDYPMSQISVSPLDVPSLNRALLQVRLGQARRNYLRRVRPLGES